MEHTVTASPPTPIVHTAPNEANAPGISWAAVLAGGFVAAALSLALLALGSGLGLSSISPWSNDGVSAKTIGIAAIVWLILMQAISGSIGGYMAGRLRTKWVGLHTDEVAFRDTAHGFLVWALGVVVTAGFLTATATALVGGGVKLGAAAITATGAGGRSGSSASGATGRGTPRFERLFRRLALPLGKSPGRCERRIHSWRNRHAYWRLVSGKATYRRQTEAISQGWSRHAPA